MKDNFQETFMNKQQISLLKKKSVTPSKYILPNVSYIFVALSPKDLKRNASAFPAHQEHNDECVCRNV